MKKEDIRKKLEELNYPEIELPRYHKRLKIALLSSGRFKKRSFIDISPLFNYIKEASMFKKVLASAGAVALVGILVVTGLMVTSLMDSSKVQARGLVDKAITRIGELSIDDRKVMEEPLNVNFNEIIADWKAAKDLTVIDKQVLEQEAAKFFLPGEQYGLDAAGMPFNFDTMVKAVRFTDRYGQTDSLGLDAKDQPVLAIVKGRNGATSLLPMQKMATKENDRQEIPAPITFTYLLDEAQKAKDLKIIDKDILKQEMTSMAPPSTPKSVIIDVSFNFDSIMKVIRFTDSLGRIDTIGLDAKNLPLLATIEGDSGKLGMFAGQPDPTKKDQPAVESQPVRDIDQMLAESKKAPDLTVIDKEVLKQEMMRISAPGDKGSSTGTMLPNFELVVKVIRFTGSDGQIVMLGLDANNSAVLAMEEGPNGISTLLEKGPNGISTLMVANPNATPASR